MEIKKKAKKAKKAKKGKKRETNVSFMGTCQEFLAACELTGIPATRRQASKWRMGRGLARATVRSENLS